MGPWVTLLASFASLTGCSLIYNPSNLPPAPGIDGPLPDSPPDMFVVVDANPTALALDQVTHGPALEGQGVGGSAPALLFVRGTDIVPGATITIVPDPPNAAVTITVGTPAIATNGKSIAVPVTIDLSSLDEGPAVPLLVTVTQPPPNQTITATTTWSLTTLDTFNLTGSKDSPADNKLFSNAVIATNLTFKTGEAMGNTRRAIIRTVAGIQVTSGVTIDASAAAVGVIPGAGGCAGGPPPGTSGSCFGKGTGAMSGGGGGGGFRTAGNPGQGGGGAEGTISGSPEVADHSAVDVTLENRGGGGGGGAGGVGGGGSGGGGGGIIELTAGGDLTLTGVTINAKGAKGSDGGGVAGASGGGGGAGGLVLLRASGTLTPPNAITVTGGLGGAPGGLGGGSTGGAGAPGRIRVDAPTLVTVPANTYTGPMLVRPASQIVRGNGSVTLAVRANTGDKFTLITLHDDGSNNTQVINPFNGGLMQPVLEVGLNRVCVVLTNGDVGKPEGANCIDLVYVP
jgi:hypothetical protein